MSEEDQAVSWAREEREGLQSQIEALESGRLHTGERRPRMDWVDPTEATLEYAKHQLEDIEKFLSWWAAKSKS